MGIPGRRSFIFRNQQSILFFPGILCKTFHRIFSGEKSGERLTVPRMVEPLEQALAALPHGAGFRFVDSLTALDPGKSASGVYRLKGSESFLAAHFPGEPIMPAVLMIEAIAQVAGIAAQGGASPAPSKLRLAAVRQAKILAAPSPGDQLCIQATITATLGGLIQAEGQITTLEKDGVGSSLVATAQVTLATGQ